MKGILSLQIKLILYCILFVLKCTSIISNYSKKTMTILILYYIILYIVGSFSRKDENLSIALNINLCVWIKNTEIFNEQ